MVTARLTTRIEVPFKLLGCVLPEYSGPSEQRIQFEASLQSQYLPCLATGEFAGTIAIDGKSLKHPSRHVARNLLNLICELIRQLDRNLHC